MADPVRFFFDQHMRNAVADELRRAGADVLTADGAGRCGYADEDQLRYATVAGRAVVTHDSDYLALAADFWSRGEAFAGVVYCDPKRFAHDPGRLITDLRILHGVLTADDMRNWVEHL